MRSGVRAAEGEQDELRACDAPAVVVVVAAAAAAAVCVGGAARRAVECGAVGGAPGRESDEG